MAPPKPPSFSTRRLHSLRHAPPPHTAATPPKPPQLSHLADKCTSMHQLKQIHAQMIVTSRISDHFAASRLFAFSALSPNGDLKYGLKVFHHIQNPNAFMFNTLIRAQVSHFNAKAAILIYVKMRRENVTVNEYTFPFVLKGCGVFGEVGLCEQVHCQVLRVGLVEEMYVGNGLVRCYSVLGEVGCAWKVFDEMSVRGLSVWTTMVCGFAQNGWWKEALRVFDGMMREGVAPSAVTLSSVLSACARSGSLELGEKVRVYMEEREVEMGVILGTALVDMYAKNGAIEKARMLFESMGEKNVATWSAMICGLASNGYGEEALGLFRRLERERVVPNDITLVGVLSACRHAGLVDVGLDIFNCMEKVYGVTPKIEHYGCMVDLLGRAGRVLEAEQLLKGMSGKPDVTILGALLSACETHGNIEVAERVVNELVALDPHNHGGYVVLSNMYAKAERWNDVVRLRKNIRKRKLNKIPGSSLVDNDG